MDIGRHGGSAIAVALLVGLLISAGRGSFVPYVNVDGYYDARYDSVNRLRLIAGTSMSWSSRTALEVNGTYQHDSHASPNELVALSVILHVFFDASHAS
jgi:hypothetical protein